MSPAPTIRHQEVVFELAALIREKLKGKGGSCKVMVAPVDLLLPQGNEEDEFVDTVVQPDIVVLCDESKKREKNLRGAPEWLIEVLSPSTAKKDEGIKRDRYQRAGVREYWLVHPTDHTLNRYRLDDEGAYSVPDVFGEEDDVDLPFPEGESLALSDLFSI